MVLGSTHFLNKCQDRLDKHRENLKDSSELLALTARSRRNSFACINPESLIGRLLYQAKVISQIITYIWVHGDQGDEDYKTATALKGYFIQGNERKLARLMTADFDDSTREGRLLLKVFPDIKPGDPYYIFPIFDKDEVDDNYIAFSIDTNIFSGWITDVDANNQHTMQAVFAYPPRPQFSDVTVTKDELVEWLNDRDPCRIKSKNIYIPTCTC